MSKYLSAGATIAILLLLAALGYQAYQIESLSGDLDLEREISAKYKSAALANYEVLTRLQSDFNGSLNACYNDYAELSERFDRYREVIAAQSNGRRVAAPTPVIPAPLPVIPAQSDRRLAAARSSEGAEVSRREAGIQKTECVIGGESPLIDALNSLNGGKQ